MSLRRALSMDKYLSANGEIEREQLDVTCAGNNLTQER